MVGLFYCFTFNFADEVTPNEQKGILAMLRIPIIWIMIYAIVVCAISLSFLDPTLSAHLASVSSLFFSVISFLVQFITNDGWLDVPDLWWNIFTFLPSLGPYYRPIPL